MKLPGALLAAFPAAARWSGQPAAHVAQLKLHPAPVAAAGWTAAPGLGATHLGVSEAAASLSRMEKSRREEAAREGMKRSL